MSEFLPETPSDLPGRHLPGWLKQVRRWFDRLTVGLNVLGTLLIVAIMLLINVDVIGKNLFRAPVSGVPEILSMSIVAIVFLQIAQTFRAGRLTRTEAVLNFIARRSARARLGLEMVFSLLSLGLVWQILSASTPLFLRAWSRGTFEGTIGDFTAPIWPVKLIILIGCAALIGQLALFALEAAFSLFGTRSGERRP